MKISNLERYNNILESINYKLKQFIDYETSNIMILDKYYKVSNNGEINEIIINKTEYLNTEYFTNTHFKGKNPTRIEIDIISKYLKQISFSNEYIYFECLIKNKSITYIGFNNIVQKNNIFDSLLDAESFSSKIINEHKAISEFKEYHKKDINYNYSANQYKFLGWQNGWLREYYDKDGELCTNTSNNKDSFIYSKSKYSNYYQCKNLKHALIEVSHSKSGSENTVSCLKSFPQIH